MGNLALIYVDGLSLAVKNNMNGKIGIFKAITRLDLSHHDCFKRNNFRESNLNFKFDSKLNNLKKQFELYEKIIK